VRQFILTTDRLSMRPLAREDAEALHDLWITPGVRRFLWDDEIIPFERTCSVIETSSRLFAEHGFGLWGARTADARLRGFAGFWHFRDPPERELLYGVAQEDWGRGYATELARAAIAYGFGRLQMPTIRASTDTGNVSSIRLLEKLGFHLVRRTTTDGLDTVFFELVRFFSDDAPRTR
jgi:ribosomal-protein-alanine N-acetyltransferase